MKLDNFIGMMTGHFDNKEQFNMMQAAGKIYPYAKHVNTVCNDKRDIGTFCGSTKSSPSHFSFIVPL